MMDAQRAFCVQCTQRGGDKNDPRLDHFNLDSKYL